MTTIAVGNQRLLKLADILDAADGEHRKRKEPTYVQDLYIHDCGTPACAWGHWLTDKGARRRTKQKIELGASSVTRVESAEKEFAIGWSENSELFSSVGCGGAKTAKHAAKYIRGFVKRRSLQPREGVK